MVIGMEDVYGDDPFNTYEDFSGKNDKLQQILDLESIRRKVSLRKTLKAHVEQIDATVEHFNFLLVELEKSLGGIKYGAMPDWYEEIARTAADHIMDAQALMVASSERLKNEYLGK